MSKPVAPPAEWSKLWVAMWAVLAVGLICGAIFLWSFREFVIAATIGFGIPETIGLLADRDPYPPLTHCIARYLPRWFAFIVIYGCFGVLAATWLEFAQPWRFGGLFALLGWLTDHFAVTYDGRRR